MTDVPTKSDFSLPFPIEFLIRDTPLSHQGKNSRAKERWKQKVGATAKAHLDELGDFFFLDDRVLAVTIFYVPPAAMEGDVDNIVKLILDGMNSVIYPSDRCLERVTVQKFEPDIEFVINDVTPALAKALEGDPPIKIASDLSVRCDVCPLPRGSSLL